jgi:hypothetical protein
MRLTPLVARLAISSCAVVAIAQVGSASAARKRDCRTAGVTVVANAKVRVYYRFATGGGRFYYACDVRRKRRRSLGIDTGLGDGITHRIALVGRHVAFEDVICERSNCYATVYRFDVVSNGVQILNDPGTKGAAVTDLRLSAKRTVYWIRRTAEGYAVLRGVPGGSPQVLENAPGVQPGSLATAGRTVYWTTAGEARSFSE